jgi:hypothetical protein
MVTTLKLFLRQMEAAPKAAAGVPMKRAILITLSPVIALAVVLLVSAIGTPTTSTTWQELEEQLPAAVQSAGLRTVTVQTEASDQVPLPLSLRVRRWLRPEPQPRVVVTGFPDSVQHYTLESVRSNARLHCRVRHSSGKVARIVLRFPPAARQEATSLRDALRRAFPTDRVSLHETTDT